MGLVRYRLHDIVRCTGYFHRSPVIEVLRKGGMVAVIDRAQISELDVSEAMRRAGLNLEGEWVFAPSEMGDQLVLYHDRPHDDPAAGCAARKVHEELSRAHFTYGMRVSAGTIQNVAARHVPGDHPLWQRLRLGHGQAKKIYLLPEPPNPPACE